jgi:hypothetical protein
MASVMKALKPGGRVVFSSTRPRTRECPSSAAQDEGVADQARAAVFPLEWERVVSTLPWQHVVIFRKRG